MRSVQRLDVLRIDGFARTDAGLLDVKGRLTRTGAFLYSDGSREWREYRPPEEVFSEDALETLKGAPLTVGHPGKVTPDNWSALAKGHVRDDVRRDGNFVQATVRVADAATIAAIEGGKLVELSCGYTAEVDEKPGEANGERYDAIQRNIRYNHVGLGAKGWGRAGSDVKLIMDSGVAISRLDAGFDQAPQTSPGLEMPSQQMVQQTSPMQPNPPPGAAQEREDVCNCGDDRRLIDGKCMTCNRPARPGAEGIPEMPHAQSTDIGDPYGHQPSSSPEAQTDSRGSKKRTRGGYPRVMASKPKAQDAVEETKAEPKNDEAEPSVEKTMARLEARADSAEAELAKMREDAKAQQDRFDAAVEARVDLVAKARALMGDALGETRGKSNDEIRKACLAKYRPSIKLDGKSSDYVEAAFDALTESHAQARKDTAKIDEGLSKTPKKEARSDEAKEKMEKRNRDAWKGESK